MKIYNHDITLYTHDRDDSIQLYSGRALGLTHADDKIQLAMTLQPEWEAIVEHYAQVGLPHTHDVIWDVSFDVINQFPDREISVYFFGDVINPHDTYRQMFQKWDRRLREIVEFVNSKNNFIQLSEELGIPVPKTLRFANLVEAKASNDVMFPCFVKPAVSDHGVGITRCADAEALAAAFATLVPEEPLQIQEEVQASAFLNLQYRVNAGEIEPLLVSEQVLDGCVHKGNRYPSAHEPWDKVVPFAEWMGDRGMKGIFAVDVAVVPEAAGTRYVAIECNPRFNGSSYPTVIAKRLNIPQWSSGTYKTQLRSLKDIDLQDIAYDPATHTGVILTNWGIIQAGKVSVLFAGTEAKQAELETILQQRL
ncbi:MAG: ATP-grasp domain-containing protein [Leptolyngbya sp. SIOISBB]|nr:ATP-grasp domain-containing protein [Leptolyngbya sp. SIOISBB]